MELELLVLGAQQVLHTEQQTFPHFFLDQAVVEEVVVLGEQEVREVLLMLVLQEVREEPEAPEESVAASYILKQQRFPTAARYGRMAQLVLRDQTALMDQL